MGYIRSEMSDDVADIGYLELQTDRDMRGSVSFLFASACVIILIITSTLLHYISFLSSIQRELQNVNFLYTDHFFCPNLPQEKVRKSQNFDILSIKWA